MRRGRRHPGRLVGSVVGIVVVAGAACGGGSTDSGTTASSSTFVTTIATISTTTAPAGCTTVLTVGCSGHDVSRLQRLLNSKGFGPATVDLQFGPGTLAMLQAFELECPTCTPDGRIVIDGDEWAFLESLPTIAPEENSG